MQICDENNKLTIRGVGVFLAIRIWMSAKHSEFLFAIDTDFSGSIYKWNRHSTAKKVNKLPDHV